MLNVFEYFSENDYLAHHGILGQKWGVRRYQNSDGSLTTEGKARYGKSLIENDKGFHDKFSVYSTKYVIKKKDRDAIYKKTREGQELRKSLYESSKECKSILDKVRKKSDEFLEDDSDKTFNELYELQKAFKEASGKLFSDVLSVYGDVPVKNATGDYNLLDVLVDKSGDDFWYYAYGDWK